MNDISKSWRRNLGVLAMLFACAVAAFRVRGLPTQDELTIGVPRNAGGQSLMELKYESEIVEEYFRILKDQNCQTDDDVARLSERDLTVVLVLQFDMQVMNGGMSQWIYNQSGAFPFETLAALERIGATTTAGYARDALKHFPNGVPRDSDERQALLRSWTEEEIQRLEATGDEYGAEHSGREGGRIFELLVRYLEANSG